MQKLTIALLATGITATALYLAGCSQSTQPSDVQSPSADMNAFVKSIASSEMTLIHAAGVRIDGKGILAISWREIFNPCHDTTFTIGRALAIGFDTTMTGGRRRDGIDLGIVSLHRDSTTLELTKHYIDGGIFYTSGNRRDGSTNIPFVGNDTYTFDISGSDKFSPLTASLVTPAALLDITSPHKKDTINTSNNLTITWTGGADTTGVVIAIAAIPGKLFHEGDDDDQGEDHDGDHHDGDHHDGDHHDGGGDDQGGDGDHITPGAMPVSGSEADGFGGWNFKTTPGGIPAILDSTRAIIVKLTSNPGTYTVSASALQQLVANTGARHLNCSVSQIISHDVSHDGGIVHVIARNGDAVQVKVQK
jgi:hypothetical protein